MLVGLQRETTSVVSSRQVTYLPIDLYTVWGQTQMYSVHNHDIPALVLDESTSQGWTKIMIY